MSQDNKKRRRGQQRIPQEAAEGQLPEPAEPQASEEAAEQPREGHETPKRSFFSFRLPFGRRKEPDAEPASATSADVSPMDFWRSARQRTHRQRGTSARNQSRIGGIGVPAWMPVVAIILATFGLLGLLFFSRSVSGAPRIGDHWHAPYQIVICGEKQPPIGTFEAGSGSPGTHGDGVMHQHPFSPAGEGSASNLKSFFDVGGGKLSGNEIQVPGYRETYKNGDKCPDGTEGVVQVFLNSQKVDNFTRYIAKDGDLLRIVFGAPEDVAQLDDRIVIADGQATREITIDVSGSESATQFSPSSLDVEAGEAVRVRLRNTADVSHAFRVSGADGEYGNGDDFVLTPDGQDPETTSGVLLPGEEGAVVVRLDFPGSVEFYDETAQSATGLITVAEGTPKEEPGEDVDSEDAEPTVEVALTDHVFTPSAIEVTGGEEFRIRLVSEGRFVHNMRIAGPDGEFETDDDILSDDVLPGETVDFVATLDEPGTYAVRCDFHPVEHTGVIQIQ